MGLKLFCGIVKSSQRGIKPVSPALAGGLSSTVPPSKSHWRLLINGMKVKVTRVRRLLAMQEITMACTKNSEN